MFWYVRRCRRICCTLSSNLTTDSLVTTLMVAPLKKKFYFDFNWWQCGRTGCRWIPCTCPSTRIPLIFCMRFNTYFHCTPFCIGQQQQVFISHRIHTFTLQHQQMHYLVFHCNFNCHCSLYALRDAHFHFNVDQKQNIEMHFNGLYTRRVTADRKNVNANRARAALIAVYHIYRSFE